jgi:hypothetical protein
MQAGKDEACRLANRYSFMSSWGEALPPPARRAAPSVFAKGQEGQFLFD